MSIIGMEFILKFATPYALPSLPCPGGIASLYHETLHIAMKDCVVVVAGSAQGKEIEGCAWSGVAKHFDFDGTESGMECDGHGV